MHQTAYKQHGDIVAITTGSFADIRTNKLYWNASLTNPITVREDDLKYIKRVITEATIIEWRSAHGVMNPRAYDVMLAHLTVKANNGVLEAQQDLQLFKQQWKAVSCQTTHMYDVEWLVSGEADPCEPFIEACRSFNNDPTNNLFRFNKASMITELMKAGLIELGFKEVHTEISTFKVPTDPVPSFHMKGTDFSTILYCSGGAWKGTYLNSLLSGLRQFERCTSYTGKLETCRAEKVRVKAIIDEQLLQLKLTIRPSTPNVATFDRLLADVDSVANLVRSIDTKVATRNEKIAAMSAIAKLRAAVLHGAKQ